MAGTRLRCTVIWMMVAVILAVSVFRAAFSDGLRLCAADSSEPTGGGWYSSSGLLRALAVADHLCGRLGQERREG